MTYLQRPVPEGIVWRFHVWRFARQLRKAIRATGAVRVCWAGHPIKDPGMEPVRYSLPVGTAGRLTHCPITLVAYHRTGTSWMMALVDEAADAIQLPGWLAMQVARVSDDESGAMGPHHQKLRTAIERAG